MARSISGNRARRPVTDPVLDWAAYLLASWWDGCDALPRPADADAAAVVNLLRRNGVPLLSLAAPRRLPEAAQEMTGRAPFIAALQQDRETLARQEAAFGEISAAWAADGIPALFVKAMGPAPVFPYMSGNLDILVPNDRQDQARRIVRDLGYVELRHLEEPNKFLLRRFHAGRSAFDLHIHGRIEWHTEFLDAGQVWRNAAPAGGGLARVPAPETGLLIALAHAVYENKALKLIELGKLIWAARTLDLDWEAVAAGAAQRGWQPGLWSALWLCRLWEERLYGACSLPAPIMAAAEAGTPDWLRGRLAERVGAALTAPIALGFANSKRLFYAKMLRDPQLSDTRRTREIVTHTLYGTHLRLHIRSQRPYLVAFEGLDGSGKSTQAALLAAALQSAGLRHRVVWTRGGGAAWLRPLRMLGKRLLGRGAPPSAADVSSLTDAALTVAGRERERAGLFRQPLARAAWPWLITLELAVSYLTRIGWPLLRGQVVVADRYVLTALVELSARLDRPDIARTLAGRLLRLLAPRPRRTYWLDVPVAVALARKEGDESAAFLERQSVGVAQLVADVGAVRLDARTPADVLSDSIVRDCLTEYEDEYRTRLNMLFCANPRPLPPAWREEPR